MMVVTKKKLACEDRRTSSFRGMCYRTRVVEGSGAGAGIKFRAPVPINTLWRVLW